MAQEADEIDIMINYHGGFEKIDRKNSRYPYCVVWTPIPILSWLLPFIGHMGICTSAGVIRDFAGSYLVSEDNMAFGRPTKYWKLDVDKVCGTGSAAWDKAVHDASEEYKCRPVLLNISSKGLLNISSKGLLNISSKGLLNISSKGLLNISSKGLLNISSKGLLNISSKGLL
ncbi:transmembrane protein 222-like isoform X2 [Oncorhynchus keta]|uniref:transmembrane protein 222-like isoform X2 n=1 Tax=Oncorhynchus keta TaxID=8018 RepID=UPI00227ABD43|nr:transmembrane protein 222-like isoform X2 [Oncorhynchus keta]